MTKFNILFSSLFLSAIVAQASDKPNPKKFSGTHNFHLELGGAGGYYSVNYEAIPLNRKKMKIALQVGTSYYPAFTDTRDSWFPTIITVIRSFGNNHAELGLGQVFIYESTRDQNNKPISWGTDRLAAFKAGYRYQKPDGRMILRVGLTLISEEPRYRYLHRDYLHLLPAVSVGWAF